MIRSTLRLALPAVAGVLGICSVAAAQDGGDQVVVPKDAQIELYTQGAQAFQAEDYDKAIRLFKASLDLGELNITHLNLGRAWFKAGDCAQAAAHYDKALSAPKIAEPTPAQVKAKVDTYRQDLETTCPGQVLVTCDPADMKLEIDGEPPVACTGQPLSLKPGKHVIIGQHSGQTVVERVEIKAMQTASPIALTLKVEGPAGPTGPTASDGIGLPTWGLITLGAGGAILLGAALYDTLVLLPDYNDYKEAAQTGDPAYETLKSDLESGQVIVRVLLGLGVAGVATGAVLYFVGGDDQPAGSSTSLAPWATPDAAGVSLGGQF